MVVETKKIMGDDNIQVAATCVRVPRAALPRRVHQRRVRRRRAARGCSRGAAAAPGVTVMDDPANNVYPMPGLLAGTNDTYVGRIRRDPTVKARAWPCG